MLINCISYTFLFEEKSLYSFKNLEDRIRLKGQKNYVDSPHLHFLLF